MPTVTLEKRMYFMLKAKALMSLVLMSGFLCVQSYADITSTGTMTVNPFPSPQDDYVSALIEGPAAQRIFELLAQKEQPKMAANGYSYIYNSKFSCRKSGLTCDIASPIYQCNILIFANGSVEANYTDIHTQ